jgi:hypothetical protein
LAGAGNEDWSASGLLPHSVHRGFPASKKIRSPFGIAPLMGYEWRLVQRIHDRDMIGREGGAMQSPAECRDKAAWARQQAERTRDPASKQAWLDIAIQWEALAETAERQRR